VQILRTDTPYFTHVHAGTVPHTSHPCMPSLCRKAAAQEDQRLSDYVQSDWTPRSAGDKPASTSMSSRLHYVIVQSRSISSLEFSRPKPLCPATFQHQFRSCALTVIVFDTDLVVTKDRARANARHCTVRNLPPPEISRPPSSVPRPPSSVPHRPTLPVMRTPDFVVRLHCSGPTT
jgi:hypothetical protein